MSRKVISETWEQATVGVGAVAPNAQNGDAAVSTLTLVVVLEDPAEHRTILIPLTEEQRAGIVQHLTGGIVIAAPGMKL